MKVYMLYWYDDGELYGANVFSTYNQMAERIEQYLDKFFYSDQERKELCEAYNMPDWKALKKYLIDNPPSDYSWEIEELV